MKRILLLISLQFILFPAFSQDSLRIIGFNIPDTVTLSQTGLMRLNLQFKTPVGDSLLGNVLLKVRVNNILLPDTVAYTQVFALNQDTFSVQNPNFGFGAVNNFVPGNNIVVVWPSTNDPNIGVDTVYMNVYVIDDTGTPENGRGEKFHCYPALLKPGQRIFCNEEFEQVRLLDLSGREYQLSSSEITVPDVSAGIYLLEFRTREERWIKRIYISD